VEKEQRILAVGIKLAVERERKESVITREELWWSKVSSHRSVKRRHIQMNTRW
jgi:hypothetical protein